ncbi:MAG: replication-relaxation family protein [Rhizobiales bacterium]|nr:replication-relaxation family protein [Hyphomicrobiales bacterium]
MPPHNAQQAKEGRKRFVRPSKASKFSLTERNLALLAYVSQHRLIASDDLAKLDGGSEQNAKRELRRLWENGYVLRPAAQLMTAAITGPQPIVYGLSNKGARLLRDNGHLIPDVDWSENTQRAGTRFIDHEVARARFMSSIEVAVRNRSDIRLLRADDIIANAPEKTRTSKTPLKWSARVPDKGREVPSSIVADDLFALVFPDQTASYFLVEIDRGQMPVRRHGDSSMEIVDGKKRTRTHFKHKLATYYHGWRQRHHVQQFGIEQVRVITVTTSQQRIETMLDALREVTEGKGSDLFLFGHEAELSSADVVTAGWISGRGAIVRLDN